MLCQTFKDLAEFTWNKIGSAKSVSFQLKEESMTDFNLLHLKLEHPTQIITREFNKREEGVNGADWEWWFTDGKWWIGFRVQAKIISITSDEFEHLHYQKGTSVPQSEKLIIQAENKGGIPRIPLYCLFMNTDELDKKKLDGTSEHHFGCSLLSAYQVKALRPGKIKHISKIQSYIYPWHKLVCVEEGKTVMEHVASFAKNQLNGNKVVSEQDLLVENPPSYVLRIINANGDNLDFEESTGSLAGVMVVNTVSGK